MNWFNNAKRFEMKNKLSEKYLNSIRFRKNKCVSDEVLTFASNG